MTNRFQKLFAAARLATLILVWNRLAKTRLHIVVSQFVIAYVHSRKLNRSIENMYLFLTILCLFKVPFGAYK